MTQPTGAQGQGRRHDSQSGDTNITASAASRNFFGVVPPHMPFWGYNSYKERHTERLSDSVATISYWSESGRDRALIGLLINIPTMNNEVGTMFYTTK